MEPILNWAFTSPASACLRMVLMSAGREEEANMVNSMAAKSIPRKRLFWISNIATSDTTRFRRLPLPPEVELHKEILRLTDLLDAIHDEEGRRQRRREL